MAMAAMLYYAILYFFYRGLHAEKGETTAKLLPIFLILIGYSLQNLSLF